MWLVGRGAHVVFFFLKQDFVLSKPGSWARTASPTAPLFLTLGLGLVSSCIPGGAVVLLPRRIAATTCVCARARTATDHGPPRPTASAPLFPSSQGSLITPHGSTTKGRQGGAAHNVQRCPGRRGEPQRDALARLSSIDRGIGARSCAAQLPRAARASAIPRRTRSARRGTCHPPRPTTGRRRHGRRRSSSPSSSSSSAWHARITRERADAASASSPRRRPRKSVLVRRDAERVRPAAFARASVTTTTTTRAPHPPRRENG